ncbi:MAG: hypothetical protein IKE53_05335 [Clostridiales bacterium]|nr:hypothetical protein [Clostridiales bacterium]
MPTSVKLQDMMSYSLILTVIAIAIVVLPVLIFSLIKLIGFKPKKREKKAAKPKPKRKLDPQALKALYLEKIKETETRYTNNLIDMRAAHLDLSRIVREYCSEASGLPYDNLTLSELYRFNMPELYNLIREFYEPEFAPSSDKDIAASFSNARGVVTSWR